MQGKRKPNATEAESQVYVGIDVCKDYLDVYLHPIGQAFRVSNDAVGIRSLKRRLSRLSIKLVVVEATGKLHRQVQRSLEASGIAVVAVNPYRSRTFAAALGQLAKTDAIDARILAVMGESLSLAPRPMPEPKVCELAELVRARQAAVANMTELCNRHGSSEGRFLKREIDLQMRTLKKHIDRIEAHIAREIAADAGLARRYQVLMSIPGIGKVAATTLVACLTELGSVSNKQIAALVGVAPFNWDSGDMRGQRHIKGGREHVRTPLYFAAVTAMRCQAGLASFAARLKAAGKPGKVTITAVIRKLVTMANTLIHEDRLWQPTRP